MDGNRKRIAVREGNLFCAPLPSGGLCVGLAARVKAPTVVAYVFGPRLQRLPQLDSAVGLTSFRPTLVAMVAWRKLRSGEWPVLGNLEPWDRTAWPIPPFAAIDSVNPEWADIRRYNDADLVLPWDEQRVPATLAAEYWEDGLYGSEALEIEADRLL
jgi:hypothetical protein